MWRKSAPIVVFSLVVGVLGLPASTALAAPPVFRAAATENSTTASPTIVVPNSVQTGDQLVLVVTANASTTATTPAGWTLLGTQTEGSPDMTSWVFTHTAPAGIGGSTVAIPLGASAKVARTLVAYAGANPAVAGSASVISGTSASLTTPAASVASNDTVVVSYWADKSSGNTGWTVPASVTTRATSIGTGGGRITAAIGDTISGPGNWPGATATSTTAGTKGIGWTIVLPPAGPPPANQPPVARFTSTCNQLTCNLDATTSTDDGTITNFAWNFGDTTTGTGITTSRTYTAAGTYTITLTVTDNNGATATTTGTVTPTTPPTTVITLPPDTPRTDTPRISDGEITDLAYLGDRVFVVGTFTSIRNNVGNVTNTINQPYLASFNINTGLVDANFRPAFGGGGVTEIALSPDGTKLFVAGRFNTVNGVAKRKVASIDPVTGATVSGFTANADAAATSVAATNTTVYVGGQYTMLNGTNKVGLAALDANTGQLLPGFQNDISGGIGVNGALTVQALVLSPDLSTLLVLHTGRQIAGQDRYGVGLIDTRTNQLLPWRTRLWDDNLQFVGGVQRVYAGAIAPGGQYFVVTSGSGGDRPPINDTAVAFPITGGDQVQPIWVSRLFDSVYSVAISRDAVYVGGHFNYMESPTATQPWPGLTNVGYGQGQGLAGYGLGDDIVIRDHIGALDPATGTALEWHPGSDSFEGNKAMLVTPRGVVTGGDGMVQGGSTVGRIAFYDFASVPAPGPNETTIDFPIAGRVVKADVEFRVGGMATTANGVQRVQLEVIDLGSNQWLQDDLTSWGSWNGIDVDLQSPGAASTPWSQRLTIPGNRRLQFKAKTFALNGTNDATKATKKIETFGLADQTPNTAISAPSGVVPTLTFTVTGTATDDVGVNALRFTLRDALNRYLQDDGSVDVTYNTFTGAPDVIGATNATWSYEVTVPYEGEWTMQAIAVDTAGQADLRSADRTWLVNATAQPPTVAITTPVVMSPPTAALPLTMAPGSPLTFTGSATDDQGLLNVEIRLRNVATGEVLASDGTWGLGLVRGWYRVSNPFNLPGSSYNWAYTAPFNLTTGQYEFEVRATDDLGLITSGSLQGKLTINVVIPGDAPPNGLLNLTGTQTGVQVLHLDLAGTATDDIGVAAVRVELRESVSGLYVQPNGTLAAAVSRLNAVLAAPGARSTTWTLAVDLPSQGDYSVTAYAYDTAGQQDPSTSGATARYIVYPGDNPPTVTEDLLAPTQGTVFTQARIVVSGRVEDDQQIARAQVAIRNAAGQYMSSTGTFTTTSQTWITAFLNSPGSLGSNFAYTTPAIPDGTYTVLVRGVDQHGFTTPVPSQRTVTVAGPTGNLPPVANFTTSCNQNICTFDARTSTDENAATLTYTWNFGNGTGSGAVPTRTYTSAATYTVALTARDEYGLTASTSRTITITEPVGNVAPVPVLNPPSCAALVCNFSAVGSADPNPGDTFSNRWNFGDGTPIGTGTAPSHTFPAPGTYIVTLTNTDGWGRAASVTRSVTVG
jgi:PKD repeat protein